MKRFISSVMPIVLILSLLFSAGVYAQETPYTPGIYRASADGNNGPITVEVSFSDNEITCVSIIEHSETNGIADAAFAKIPSAVVNGQTLAVDTVSGCTNSSRAILQAVENCVEQAGGDIGYLKSNQSVEDAAVVDVSINTDVVVVGAGISGMLSALRASDSGANVVILEKMSSVGGSSKLCGSGYIVCQTDENQAYWITDEEDTIDNALERWKTYQARSVRESMYPDYNRLTFMLQNSMEALDWETKYGITFTAKRPIDQLGMAVVTGDAPDEEGEKPAIRVMRKLEKQALQKGIEIYLDTPAEALLFDENEKVIGVHAVGPSGDVDVYAQSVILACGSCTANYAMVAEMIPELGDCYTTGSVGNTGDGTLMAQSAGAVLVEEPWVQSGFTAPTLEFIANNRNSLVFMEKTSPLDVSESTYYRLVVDRDGNRFMNEAENYSYQVMTLADHANGPYYALYNNLDEQVTSIAESGVAIGKAFKGETVGEVAAKAGIDQDAFEKTVTRYNEMAKAGVDDDFAKDADHLKAYENGPYYLIQVIPGSADVLGGIKTDYNYQCMREDGTLIDGLWAVGSMSNGQYFNQWYFGGASMTFGATSGWLAGQSAAAHALANR